MIGDPGIALCVDGDGSRETKGIPCNRERKGEVVGLSVSAVAKGGVELARGYRVPILAPWLCAIFMAAVAVSVGVVPELPALSAVVSKVEQLEEDELVVLTHAARMLARP